MAKAPDAFRTISEVADWLDTPAHVLRFWESKFSQIKPVKRAGGRRYYRREDMALLGGIKKLLHEDGMTIKAAQQLLRQEGVKHVAGLCEIPLDGPSAADEQPGSEPDVREPSISLVPDDQTPLAEAEGAPQITPEIEPELVEEAPQFTAGFAPEPQGAEESEPVVSFAPEPAPEPEPEPEPDSTAMSPSELAPEEPAADQQDRQDSDAPELPFGESQELPSFLKTSDPEPEPVQEDTVAPSPELPSFLTKEEEPKEPLGTDIPDDPADADITAPPGLVSIIAATSRDRLFDQIRDIAPLAQKLAAFGSGAPRS